jgi:hypothetical protein
LSEHEAKSKRKSDNNNKKLMLAVTFSQLGAAWLAKPAVDAAKPSRPPGPVRLIISEADDIDTYR